MCGYLLILLFCDVVVLCVLSFAFTDYCFFVVACVLVCLLITVVLLLCDFLLLRFGLYFLVIVFCVYLFGLVVYLFIACFVDGCLWLLFWFVTWCIYGLIS